MRRAVGLFMLVCSFALIAAAPKATPKPTATPVPTATPFTSNAPSVMVYPFEVPSDIDAKMGQAIAQVYQQVLVQSGGLTVLAPTTPIKREDYAKYAFAQKADYYISGYVQPIGNAASIVANIVDAKTALAVYSVTTHVESVNEVASQAIAMRGIIFQAAGIDRPQITTTASTPAPTSSEGASVNVGNVLSNIFKGRGKGKGAATPAPTATPAKPSRAVIVNHLIGSASTADQDNATNALARDFGKYYNASLLKNPVQNVSASADAICGSNRNNTIVSGVLNATSEGSIRKYNSYALKLDVYTCFGAVLYTTTENGTDLAKVVQTVTDDYQKAFPNNQ